MPAYEQFCRHERGMEESSVRVYLWVIARVTAWLAERGKSWDTAHVNDLSDYIQTLSRAGQSASTLSQRVNIVRHYMRFLGRTDYGDILAPQRKRQILFCPSEGDTAALIAAADGPRSAHDHKSPANRPQRDRAILQLAWSTGLRVSELCALKVEDVTCWHTRTIFVRHGKGNKQRTVYFDTAAGDALLAWLRTLPQPIRKSAYLFPAAKNPECPIRNGEVRRVIERAAKRVPNLANRVGPGVSRRNSLTPHTFRRAFATHTMLRGKAADNQAVMESVRQQLGHKWLDTTAIYLVYVDPHTTYLPEYKKRFPLERLARGEPADVFPPAPTQSGVDPSTAGITFQ